ncbi:serine hydrolase [Maribacter sp. IgM3_T14_3]|uniref:serine hydrolase n=1 Tax=Maribacter sp. IgM3_T14_3 TaxID=3415140 RepID=UPI003C6F3130
MQNKSIGKHLIYQRKLKGYSQQQLSEKTEVTVRTIQRIEKGKVHPHLQTIKLLAAALGIDMNDLLPLENPKEESLQKKWLLLLHATPILGFVLPLCNVLFPLFLWIHKREDNPIYDRHGVKVINFQITALILYVLSFVALLTVEKWGFLFFIVVVPLCLSLVLGNIVYAVKTHKCYYLLFIPFLRAKTNTLAKAILLLLAGMASFSCSSQGIEIVTRLDGTTISNDSLTSKINQLMVDAKMCGMAVTVFNDSSPVYQKTFGYKDYPKKLPLTDSTNIYGASLSKALFSVVALKLVEEGLIDLDTPLESYLPKKIYDYEPKTRWHDDFTTLKEDSLYHKITARMCLSHTTGFANWRWDEPDNKLKVHGEPGAQYGYSGEGFVYLQVVLEKLTGKGLQELADERIFKPLKMHNSAYEWKARFDKDFAFGHNKESEKYKKDIDNEPRSGSTLETTASDYTKFLQAVLRKQLISQTAYKELFSPQIRLKSLIQFNEGSNIMTDKYDHLNLSYGLGWGYLQSPYGKGVLKEGHGNGFQHYSILFPQAGKGIMIMTNSDNAESIFKELLEVAIKDVYTPWEWENYIPYNKS